MTEASSQATLQRIAALARAGRLDEAAVMAAGAMASSVGDPVLAALAGTIEFHRGQFERAANYLEQAYRAHPADMTVRANLAQAYFHGGRVSAALELCDEAGAKADSSLRMARLGGHLAQEAGEHERAIGLYRIVVERDPGDWAAWNNLGNALSATGAHGEAADALENAVALAPDSQPIRLNLGNELVEAGRYAEAERTLRTLADDFPDDPKPLLSLYGFYRRAGLEDRAYAVLADAAGRAPHDPEILTDYGHEAARFNDHAVAETAFEAALAHRPGLGKAFAGLATVFERTNRDPELDPLRERAVAQSADDQSIAYIDALRLKRAEHFEEALAALETAGEIVIPGRRFHLQGTMLDRLGRHEEAFAAFHAMNENWKTDSTRPEERALAYRNVVQQGMDLLTPEWLSGWTPCEGPFARPAPIFLLGFPRSGTTLLDTMLMADPNCGVLEEEPFMADIERELGGIEALPALSAPTIHETRASYFERVGKVIDLRPETVVIDKHPLHTNKLPVIMRLFPDARFILALRHPCDVVLSCFITNFRANHAMANFIDLETAAELYDMTFSYWEKARSLFDLPVHTVVYERLVEDTARELRPLFDAYGLAWPDDQLDHRKAARERGLVRTASYAQVTEPIYTRAAGRWQRYAGHLEPVLERLGPWVEHHGYSFDDGRFAPWPDEVGQ